MAVTALFLICCKESYGFQRFPVSEVPKLPIEESTGDIEKGGFV